MSVATGGRYTRTVADSNGSPLVGGSQGQQNVTVAGTPVQLTIASTPCTILYVTARTGNKGNIAWGWSNAVRATAGAEVGSVIIPGETIVIPVSDVQKIWIDGTSGDGVSLSWGS